MTLGGPKGVWRSQPSKGPWSPQGNTLSRVCVVAKMLLAPNRREGSLYHKSFSQHKGFELMTVPVM